MPSPTGALSFPVMLQDRGTDLAALGAAYVVIPATLLLTVPAFAAARHYLVISPNRWTRDFGIHVSMVLATLLIAIVLENEFSPLGSAFVWLAWIVVGFSPMATTSTTSTT